MLSNQKANIDNNIACQPLELKQVTEKNEYSAVETIEFHIMVSNPKSNTDKVYIFHRINWGWMSGLMITLYDEAGDEVLPKIGVITGLISGLNLMKCRF